MRLFAKTQLLCEKDEDCGEGWYCYRSGVPRCRVDRTTSQGWAVIGAWSAIYATVFLFLFAVGYVIVWLHERRRGGDF